MCENCESSSEALPIFNFVKSKIVCSYPSRIKKIRLLQGKFESKGQDIEASRGLYFDIKMSIVAAQDVMAKLSIETLPHNLVKLNMIYKIAMKSDLNRSLRTGACPHLCMFPFIKKVGERPGSARPTNENDIT